MTTEGTATSTTVTMTPEARIAALEGEIEKQKDLAQTWMSKATHYEKSLDGKPVEEVLKALKERDKLLSEKVKADPSLLDAEVERRVNDVKSKYDPLLQEKDKEIGTLKSSMKELRIVDAFISEASDKLYPKATEDFKSYIRRHCDLDENGNTVIKDADGKVRLSKTNAGMPMTKSELVSELMETHDHWFTSRVQPGGKLPETKFTGQKITTFAELSKLSPEAAREAMAGMDEATRLKIASEDPALR